MIYWAQDPYVFFFPKGFYKFFNLGGRLAEGLSIHFFIGWLFTINGILYMGYLGFSKEWRLLFPNRNSWKEFLSVVLHDLGLKKEVPPQEKFNAAQRIVYTAILFMGAGSVLSGLAIYKPTQLSWLTFLLGGYRVARFIHFVLTLGYCAFFVLHITQVIRAGWNNFRAMVSGFEVTKE